MALPSLCVRCTQATVLASVLLVAAGCGGGPDGETAGNRMAAGPAANPDREPRRQALAEPPAPVGIDALFDWAERAYAGLFPQAVPTQALSAGGVTYTVRFYPTTGNYIGVDPAGGVWGYGPFTDNLLKPYGQVADFRCLVTPSACVPEPPRCQTAVATGFTGNLDAVYESAGGGDGSDGGDSGSAGVGGSEGKVLGGRVSIYRLRDGALLAQGLTDTTLGLVTVQWCKSDLPVLVELQGAPGARYFDEAVNDLVDFPLTQKLRALVDRFDENVGVSAQTEAAYLYALNQIQGDAGAVAAGNRALATDGVPLGLGSVQVQQANQAVLAEVNRRLTDRLQQVSMKALATPIDQRSGSNALPRNRYGRTAALTGGFAKLARSYNGATPTPALTFSRQFALDFTDGRIDDYTLDNRAAGPAGEATYRGTEAGLKWTIGQGLLGQQFGQNTTRLDGDPYVAAVSVWAGFSPDCKQALGETRIVHHYLSTIGTLTEVENRAPAGGCIWDPGYSTTSRLNVLTGVRKLVSQGTERAFAVGLDGRVHGWGYNGCGRVGNGVTGNSFTSQPTLIQGLDRVVDMVAVEGINVALTRDGEVYTWGALVQPLAGYPAQASDPACTESQRFTLSLPQALPVSVIATPRRVPGLTNVVALSAGGVTVNAVTADGRVFQWGNVANASGRPVVSVSPVEVARVSQPRKVVTSVGMSFAIVAGGRVATWWERPLEIFDRPAAGLTQPQVLAGLDGMVDIESDILGTTLTLRADGSLWYWGRWSDGGNGSFTVKPRQANLPVRDAAGRPLPGLPRIVRLSIVANYASAIGADNRTYRLVPGRDPAGAYWSADGVYDRVPSPF